MVGHDLVVRVLAVELGAFVAALLLLFGHGVAMERADRRQGPRLHEGRELLRQVARGDAPPAGYLERLAALPLRVRVRLFTELAPSLAGAQRDELSRLARHVGLAAHGERLCRSRFWWRRLHGVRLLGAIGAGHEVVPPLLDDPSPSVRAEAVEWVADHPDPPLVDRLLRLLAEPRGEMRFAIRDSLLRLGARAIEPLEAYLEAHGGAAVVAGMDVAAGLPHPRFASAALRLRGDALPHVRAQAAGLLGAIGGDDAVAALQSLLRDGDAEVRAAAAGGLGRLGHWPAAPALAALLRDPAWDVRRAAAVALRALGSPGLLLLRRALGDDDAFAADMARQVLDLPDAAGERGAR
jgi:HEAT repeat protein